MENQLRELLVKLELRHDQVDMDKLKEAIDYLNEKGLSDLCQKLLRSTKARKFLEILTELNFTVQLLNSFPLSKNSEVFYEPKDTKRPIDLVIKLDRINYFIQIKSLSNSIRENKQAQIIREIRSQIRLISSKRGLVVHISENFKKENVSEMIKFIKENLTKIDSEKFTFKAPDNVIAEIKFHAVEKSFRDHLVLYSFGDLEAVEITGITKDQIKGALYNAVGAFEKDSSKQNINLIVSEIKSAHHSIDFADALYGTTFSTDQNGIMRNHRDIDGLFMQENFSKKIAGVIVLHRKEMTLTSQYEKVVCSNPSYDYIKPIINLIHDRIIGRFTWVGDSFFE
jgi:hypothetical protein